MKRLGYYNGKYGPLEEMMIPMNDRVCWFGDGVYDAGPCRNYKIFALDEHVDRFFRNAEWLGVEMPVTKEEFKELLDKLVHEMDSGDLFVYMQLTRAASVPRQHPYTDGPGSLWVTLNPAKIPDGRVPIKLITREDTRFFHCNIKTLNLIPAVMASEAAKQAGCDEAVLYRAPDRVTEGSHSNIHIIKDGTLYTAPLDNLILPGIARAHLLRACEALGIPYVEEPYTLEDLANADEILMTSSSNLCRHADQLDGKPAGMKDPETYDKILTWLIDEFHTETGG